MSKMILNHNDVIFSTCRKATSQTNLETLRNKRELYQLVIDYVLNQCPLELHRRGHKLQNGIIHGIIKGENFNSLVYVAPVPSGDCPLDGQVLQAVEMCKEFKPETNVKQIMFLVVALDTGETHQMIEPFNPPYGDMESLIYPSYFCAQCQYALECGQCLN